MSDPEDRIVVIGAGMGGLSAAIRLAAAGRPVTVIEAASSPGGKMRTLPTPAGPVDAGPTVLTMREVFDDLFAAAGARLEDRLTLIPQKVLARHWWPDGATLDLYSDPEESAAAIRACAGAGAEDDFRRFRAAAAALHDAFEAPVMRSPTPSRAAVAAAAMTRPALWPWLRPGRSLASALAAAFRDPRLAQLFGRYATYVGGAPALSPAVLALIWRAEERGVWAVEGGMGRLAGAMAALAEDCGARLRYGTRAEHIIAREGAVAAVAIAGGEVLPARHVVFNGDPASLRAGLLGPDVLRAVPESATEPRSHSAWVWSFAARATGLHLALHNVFFGADPRREFPPIAGGRMPEDPSLYICAQDRARGIVPDGAERFEIIMNAPPSDRLSGLAGHEEFQTCRDRTFGTLLTRFGLRFDPEPGPEALTRPRDFAALFPGSRGSIYGLSPHGSMAAFARPVAQTAVPGLWLAGGGAHPGAGVPMATLSGRHAAEAILTLAPRASTSPSGRTAMPGGTSTASRTTAAAPSRS